MTGSWNSPPRGKTLLCCLLIAVQCAGCAQPKSPPGAAPQVQVTRVVQRDVSINSEWVATLDGYVNAQIQPQVSGYLIRSEEHTSELQSPA